MAYKMDLDKKRAPIIPEDALVIYYEEAKSSGRKIPDVMEIMMIAAIAAKRKVISHSIEHFDRGKIYYRISIIMKPAKKERNKKEE